MKIRQYSWTFILSVALGGCATTRDTQVQPASTARCSTESVALDTDFPTGNIASCETAAPNQIAIKIDPEDAPPINCSAWYAFRLTPQKAGMITISLNYEFCGHRYWPKISTDGQTWKPVEEEAVVISELDGTKQATFTVHHDNTPLFVAGQEIVAPSDYEAWLDQIGNSPDVKRWILGKSLEGRDIPATRIMASGTEPRKQIILIGRQHPPEITGALAMFAFVETLLSDEPLARDFRTQYETVLVPMLNPDGVVRGHWRHNMGHTDLNRDWGPFEQPETRLMNDYLEKIAKNPEKELQLLVDFHSTHHDIFYTIPDDYPTNPPFLIRNWLNRLGTRMPDYPINRDANHNLDQSNSKNYVYSKYGAPTVTFEIGDETDRSQIKKIGREAALALMETMLEKTLSAEKK